MIEKQIKDNYRLGLQRGILELDDCFYIPVRITGTGLSLRKDGNGKTIVADRQKVDFCSPAFLEHAKTLPILCEHPKEGMLTSENLKNNPIIGNCIDAWIQQDEVWGLARIFDKTLLEKMGKDINSTSPAVWVGYEKSSEDGIVKEAPASINHLAFVDKGHWDINGSIGYDDSERENVSSENSDIISEKINLSEGEEVMAEDLTKTVDAEIKADKGETVTVEAKPAEVKADEEVEVTHKVEEITDEDEVEEISDEDEVEEISDEDEEVDEVEEISADEAETEVIDSDTETDEDKSRDKAVDEMRSTCDSAHDSLGVKMPIFKGRQTMRSVVNKFVQANRSFVDTKYANLAVDSYTKELASEVLKSTLNNIRSASDRLETKKEGFVDTGKGYSTLNSFGWSGR
nr:MAG TPA: hypothetical protein [Caudoviricetes sp.]